MDGRGSLPDVAARPVAVTPADDPEPRDTVRLDLVLPVHNEAAWIVATLDEWLAAAQALGVDLRIIVCEDGSTDGTRGVLVDAAERLPLHLVTGPSRKGYSQAVVDGLRATTAPWVCCADGDGQCDPNDLGALLARRGERRVVTGLRRPRRDPAPRRWMSGAMRLAFVTLHGIRLQDPSSPYCLMTSEVAHAVTTVDPLLPQGYWWEFHIRRRALGVDVVEVPVHHRARPSGTTQVYLPRHLPTIVAAHLRGLWLLRSVT